MGNTSVKAYKHDYGKMSHKNNHTHAYKHNHGRTMKHGHRGAFRHRFSKKQGYKKQRRNKKYNGGIGSKLNPGYVAHASQETSSTRRRKRKTPEMPLSKAVVLKNAFEKHPSGARKLRTSPPPPGKRSEKKGRFTVTDTITEEDEE
jgi:hypothetical protein